MIAGCRATQASINWKNAVLNGKARAVAMHPPQRNAAANSQGLSRSRRSSNQSTASGTTASKVDSMRALRNTLATSGGRLARTLSWISVANARTTRSTALIRYAHASAGAAGSHRRRDRRTYQTSIGASFIWTGYRGRLR